LFAACSKAGMSVIAVTERGIVGREPRPTPKAAIWPNGSLKESLASTSASVAARWISVFASCLRTCLATKLYAPACSSETSVFHPPESTDASSYPHFSPKAFGQLSLAMGRNRSHFSGPLHFLGASSPIMVRRPRKGAQCLTKQLIYSLASAEFG